MSRFPAQNFAAAAQRDDARSNLASWYTPGLSDALGDRLLMSDNASATSLELLRFKSEFSYAPTFEPLLRQRMSDVADLAHPGIGTVRGVEWLGKNEGLALISNQVVGRRLSEVLRDARGPQFAASLIRQVIPALAALEAHGDGLSHGLVTPERIVITPDGRLVLIEHVLGSVLADAHLTAGRLTSEFGLSVYHLSPDLRHSSVSDVSQVAHLAMLLLTGQRTDLDQAASALRHAHAPGHVRRWLESALLINGKGFTSARAANEALLRWPGVESADHPQRSLFQLSSAEGSDDAWPEMTPANAHGRATMVDFAQARRSRPAVGSAGTLRTPDDARAAVADAAPAVAVEQPAAAMPTVVDTGVRLTVRAWVAVALAIVAVAEAIVITALLATWPQSAAEPATPGVATPAAAAPSPGTGSLEVPARPAGARITVDGAPRGTSPMTMSLPIGRHEVTITAAGSTTRQTVEITAGQSTVVSPR